MTQPPQPPDRAWHFEGHHHRDSDHLGWLIVLGVGAIITALVVLLVALMLFSSQPACRSLPSQPWHWSESSPLHA